MKLLYSSGSLVVVLLLKAGNAELSRHLGGRTGEVVSAFKEQCNNRRRALRATVLDSNALHTCITNCISSYLYLTLVCLYHGFVPRKADCGVCYEEIDDARDCLRECNKVLYVDKLGVTQTNSLLDQCLDDIDNNSKDTTTIEDLDDLSKCCNFDNSCKDTMAEVQLCLVQCIDSCLPATSQAWFDCVQDETGHHGCSRTACWDEFYLDEVKDDLKFGGSSDGDLFDFEHVQARIEKLALDDMDDCSLLEDFVETACKAGDDCCDKCQPELAATIDCLINDVITPYVGRQLNKTLPACPITVECETNFSTAVARNGGDSGKGGKRDLSEDDIESFHKVLRRLPSSSSSSSKRSARTKEAILQKMKEKRQLQADQGVDQQEASMALCQRKMETNVLVHNMTYAANSYMACIDKAVFEVLEDPDDSSSSATSSRMKRNLLVSYMIFALGAGVYWFMLLI